MFPVWWICRFWLTYCCTALCCTLRMGALSSQRPQLPQLPANMLVAQSRCNTCLEEQLQSEPEEPISKAGGFCCGKKCMFFLARLPPPAPWNGLRPFYLLLRPQNTAEKETWKPVSLLSAITPLALQALFTNPFEQGRPLWALGGSGPGWGQMQQRSFLSRHWSSKREKWVGNWISSAERLKKK